MARMARIKAFPSAPSAVELFPKNLTHSHQILVFKESRTRRAFTLIELLVATAVMALILVLLLQIAEHTLQASHVTTQRLDSTQSARRALDALSSDLASAVLASGATILVKDNGGSPSLAFLTSQRGPSTATDPPRFLAVNYKLENHQLTRGYKSVKWTDSNLLAAAETAAAASSPSVLAPGILQFAVLAVLEDGTSVSVLNPPTAAWVASGAVLYEDKTVPTGWTALVPAVPPTPSPLSSSTARVRSLLVAIAAVDEQNFALLKDAQRDRFAQPTTADPVKEWEAVLDPASLPGPARSAIRFHSKLIPLP